jgi:shikimate dehydrogenase
MPQAIDGKTTLLGLIGEHISYTQSPALHNRAAQLLARNEIYLPWSMPAADVAEFLRLAWRWGGVGFNVTTPHKELVAGLYPSCGLKSVNTLFRGPHGWQATSTDGEGFAHGLARLGRPLAEFTRVIILGSGGVTTALLAFMAKQVGPKPDLCIVRRSASRDAALTAAAQTTLRFVAWTCDALQQSLVASDESSLLIQASSAPQLGDDLGFLVPALAGFKGTVCDLVYRKPSALYHAAVAMGLPAQDGGPMLIEQARLSQQLWWGQAAAFDDLLAVLRARP